MFIEELQHNYTKRQYLKKDFYQKSTPESLVDRRYKVGDTKKPSLKYDQLSMNNVINFLYGRDEYRKTLNCPIHGIAKVSSLSKSKMKDIKIYSKWWSTFTWMMKCDLTFRQELSPDQMSRRFHSFICKFNQMEHIQSSWLLVAPQYPRSHIHVLVSGKDRSGNTISNMSINLDYWKRSWCNPISWSGSNFDPPPLELSMNIPDGSYRANKIELVKSNFKVSRYLAKNLILAGSKEFYWKLSDDQLLKQFRKP
jgi:hypothetical protein